ncbi:MAG: hypothetical protein QOD53_489 [Thermoleophilaceae bacterium]|nr:hypothetical protein [Thermoleophilaceae bacterium]
MSLLHLTSMRTSSRRALRPGAALAVPVIASLALAAPALASMPPTAHVDAPTDVTVTGATLHATINPHGNGGGGGIYWDFGALDSLGDKGPHALGESASATNEDQHVSIQVAPVVLESTRASERNSLWNRFGAGDDGPWVRPSPTTSIKYGLNVAYNPYGPAHAFTVPAEITFPAPTEPPSATTGAASVLDPRGEVLGETIVLKGTLDLKNQGFPRIGFEYGKSKAYGKLCGFALAVGLFAEPGGATPLLPGGAQTGQVITRPCWPLIDALKRPGMVLHYRIVADNGAPGGPAHGADATFVVPAAHSLAVALSRSLAVGGPAARVSRILAKGGYATAFSAPRAGTAQITWSFRSKGGKTVTLARGRHKAARKSTFTVKVKLTKQGRALLTKLTPAHPFLDGPLSAKGTFAPKKGKAGSKTKRFSFSFKL